MVTGWRKAVQRVLRAAIKALEKRPLKRWTFETQRLGIAIVFAIVATTAALGCVALYFGIRIERSHDIQKTINYEADSLEEKWPCPRGEDNRASDLCAQWKAADAARKAAEWSIVAFIVGTIVNVMTLLGVGAGFFETRRATGIARESLSADTRAWLEVSYEPRGMLQVDEDLDEVFLEGVAKVRNVGNSPATGVQFSGLLYVASLWEYDLENRLVEYCDERALVAQSRGQAVFPGDRAESVQGWVTARGLGKLRSTLESYGDDDVQLYVFGCITYTSPHVDKVCYTGFMTNVDARGPFNFTDPVDGWERIALHFKNPEVTIVR